MDIIGIIPLRSIFYTVVLISFYLAISSIKNSWAKNAATPRAAHTRPPVQPAPRAVRYALALLIAVAAALLILTLPAFTPEHIFRYTSSPLHTPLDELFMSLLLLRPNNTLTAADDVLHDRLAKLDGRLLYLQFGPHVTASCYFCNTYDQWGYFAYAAPLLLGAHLANLFVVTAATSALWTGAPGRRWRFAAVAVAVIICAVDAVFLVAHDRQEVAQAAPRFASTVADVGAFYWNARRARLFALAALDAVLALVLYLTATGRAFVRPPTLAERVERAADAVSAARAKTNIAGILRNTARRDDELREHSNAFWRREGRLMADALGERDVVDGISDALGKRLNIQNLTRDADAYTSAVLKNLDK